MKRLLPHYSFDALRALVLSRYFLVVCFVLAFLIRLLWVSSIDIGLVGDGV